MTQRIKPDRPIWPTVPGDTRSTASTTGAGSQSRPRATGERGQLGQAVPPSTAETFGSFVG